ncbi:MAG: signal peptidase I [Sphaerochaetaceae bacterium]
MSSYAQWITEFTERRLTERRRRKEAEKVKKQEKKTLTGEILSWVDAIVFAVIFVLILNQFLFQLFMIPTPSMVDTLLVKDRVYVSKTSYGIEIYPTGPKIFSSAPLRDDVIVFYNPQYESKGPVFDILSQMLYMATFSLVNIDVDENGNPRERLYVKRAAALNQDIVTFSNGTASIRGLGQSESVEDPEFRKINNLSTNPKQTIDQSLYSGFDAYGQLLAYQEKGLSKQSPNYLLSRYQTVSSYNGLVDYYDVNRAKEKTSSEIDPSDISARSAYAHYENGIYVPAGYTLPLGDNRDNSQDGRYFGPVSNSDIIGKVRFIFWPFNRASVINR